MRYSFALIPLVALLTLPTSAADIAEGKALSVQCSACHGKNGISRDPEAPNLAGQSAIYLEKQLVEYKKGIRQDRRMSLIAQTLEMPQIKSLAAYYSAFEISVTPPKID
jgi:cytochrome c553